MLDENGKVKEGYEARAEFLLGEYNTALGTEYDNLSQIFDANGKIKDSIYGVIEAKKAQILLEAHEDDYRQAVENVAAAGLDTDYLGKPFGPMPHLMAIAEDVTKVHAICMKCGGLAQYSHRIIEGDKLVVLGETESYEPALFAVQQGFFSNALERFSRLFDEKDTYQKAEIYKKAGICYKKLGDFENARTYLSEANNIYPDHSKHLMMVYAKCMATQIAVAITSPETNPALKDNLFFSEYKAGVIKVSFPLRAALAHSTR